MATTTTQTTSSPLPSGYGETKRSKGRVSIALTAFVAIMRRDITVTAREFIAFPLHVLIQSFPLHFRQSSTQHWLYWTWIRSHLVTRYRSIDSSLNCTARCHPTTGT
jgi:hypothetical protein